MGVLRACWPEASLDFKAQREIDVMGEVVTLNDEEFALAEKAAEAWKSYIPYMNADCKIKAFRIAGPEDGAFQYVIADDSLCGIFVYSKEDGSCGYPEVDEAVVNTEPAPWPNADIENYVEMRRSKAMGLRGGDGEYVMKSIKGLGPMQANPLRAVCEVGYDKDLDAIYMQCGDVRLNAEVYAVAHAFAVAICAKADPDDDGIKRGALKAVVNQLNNILDSTGTRESIMSFKGRPTVFSGTTEPPLEAPFANN